MTAKSEEVDKYSDKEGESTVKAKKGKVGTPVKFCKSPRKQEVTTKLRAAGSNLVCRLEASNAE